MKSLAVLVGILLLSIPVLAEETGYRCTGIQPFWSLRIERGLLTFRSMTEGSRDTSLQPPLRAVGIERGLVSVFKAHTGDELITIMASSLAAGKCTDESSRARYDFQAVALIGGRVYYGCCDSFAVASLSPPAP